MSTARVDFTRGAAERIARAVRIIEQGRRDQSGPTFGSVADAPAQKTFRVCTFTGSWSTNQFKTVTFRGVTSTPNTVQAINIFVPFSGSSAATRNCAIAKEGTAWYLIAAEC